MSEKQRFITALERKPITGHVPHFELVFFLTRESLGIPHVQHYNFGQWSQMSREEQALYLGDIVDCHVKIADKYNHSAIFVHNTKNIDHLDICRGIREKSGDKYFLMIDNDPTFSIPNGDKMADFAARIYEDPDGLKKEAEDRLTRCLKRVEMFEKNKELLDGFAMCADYCFNTNPFFSPAQFAEFIAPYLARAIKEMKDAGFYVIKHTDGNIMPIVDQMVQCKPHALHSIDPQAGVDLAEVKRLYGDRVCLIGNVNCGLLQTGTDEEVAADVRRALRQGMPGYGYIFSTSNCVYTGMALSRYELMHKIWREEGIYA